MAIISEQENFLLKFKQESSDSSFKSLDVSVYKHNDKLVVEMRHDKKGSPIKVEIDSLVEIINYVQKKASTKPSSSVNFNSCSQQGEQNNNFSLKKSVDFSTLEAEDLQVGNAEDLIRDISKGNDMSFYNAQADVIFANAVDMNAIKEI